MHIARGYPTTACSVLFFDDVSVDLTPAIIQGWFPWNKTCFFGDIRDFQRSFGFTRTILGNEHLVILILKMMLLPRTVTSMGTLTSPLAFRRVNSYFPVSPRLLFSLDEKKQSVPVRQSSSLTYSIYISSNRSLIDIVHRLRVAALSHPSTRS